MSNFFCEVSTLVFLTNARKYDWIIVLLRYENINVPTYPTWYVDSCTYKNVA